MDSSVWIHAQEENFEQAANWYLARATDLDDRAQRLDDIARQLKADQRVEWLEDMEQSGEPIQKAWDYSVEQMVSSDELERAMHYLPKVSANNRKDVLKKIYSSASQRHYFYVNGGSVDYYTLKAENAAFMNAYPACRDFVHEKNQEAVMKFTSLLEGVERQLDLRLPSDE